MTTLTSSQSLFLTVSGSGGSGGGSDLIVIDNLESTSSSAVLSAKQGNVLKLMIDDVNQNINIINESLYSVSEELQQLKDSLDELEVPHATEFEYGTVKIDNKTIKINEDGQLYLNIGSGELLKTEFVFKPNNIGQSEFTFIMNGYTPEDFVDLLYYNTTKVHATDYVIEAVNVDNYEYKVVLKNSVTSLNAVYNLVILYNDTNSPYSKLTKLEYVLNVSPQDSSILEIPTSTYNPETFVDLLFNNTVKVHGNEYEILSNSNGYYIKLKNPPSRPSNAFYNLVLITNGLTSGGGYVDVSRFYEGTNPPINNTLIWYKTS